MEKPLTLTRREVVASTTGRPLHAGPNPRPRPMNLSTDRIHRKAHAC